MRITTRSTVRVTAAAALVIAALAARPAEARLLDLYAGGRAGGLIGGGSGTASGVPDFFERTRGPGVGFDLGIKVLVFDLSADFLQVFDSNGRAGTLTQFWLGFEIDVPVGHAKLHNRQSRSIFRPGLAGGIALGTPHPVSPPLNNDQVSDKGIVSQLKLAYEYFLDPYVGVGVEGDAGYHYFLWGQVVNAGHNSSGYQLTALGTVTFHLGW